MTKTIYTSKGEAILVDDADYPQLSRHGWNLTGRGYATATIRRKPVMMHRLIMSAPFDMLVDHVNGDVLDNRRENLRIATQSQNMHNRRRNTKSTSQYKGVSWHAQSGRWIVHIRYDGKTRHVGLFTDEIAAAEAYDREARTHFGEFATLNFPTEGERSAA